MSAPMTQEEWAERETRAGNRRFAIEQAASCMGRVGVGDTDVIALAERIIKFIEAPAKATDEPDGR